GGACHTTSGTVPPRYGFAVFKPACYSSTPPPGRIPPEVFRAGRKRPSGPLAQTVSVIADLLSGIRLRPAPALPATDCAVPPASASLTLCFYSTDSACSRRPSYPASTSSRAHSFEPFRLRPWRPSAFPQRRSLPLFQGALRLPSTALQSPPTPTLPDRLQGHAPLASLVPRPWSLGDSKPGIRPDGIKNGNDITRITDPP
ncbi:MAG: hypothetical protein IKP46_01610, partial [Bacteroidales bacterium]|nr:hypothetical protein [Bacteroidales bacterium]